MIRSAFVLAAGRGERLRPLTDKTPKPLLKISGKPLLEIILENLRELKLERVVLNAWHLKDRILEFAKDIQKVMPFEVCVSDEHELLGTGGGLKQAVSQLHPAPFLMLNGDCLWRGDIQAFVRSALKQTDVEGTWWLTPEEKNQTLIGYRGSELVQIGDLWKKAEPERAACFSGIQLISKISKEDLPDQGCIIRNYWIPRLKRGSKLGVISHGLDEWNDIGTPERYEDAKQRHLKLAKKT